MVIIGLSGSTDASRDAVAKKVDDAKLARLVAYSLCDPRHGASLGERRAKRVNAILGDCMPSGIDGIVLSHIRTREEADEVRRRGGFMWHVEGYPSCDVPIQREDLLVTDKDGGHRHFLDPVEALSETLLQHRARVA